MIYADDIQVYGNFKPSEIFEGIACMQRNSQAVFDWSILNGLERTFKKTKAIIFGSTQNLAMLRENLPKITIAGSLIPYVEKVKNLGLLMTPTLNISNLLYWHTQYSLSNIHHTLRPTSNLPKYSYKTDDPLDDPLRTFLNTPTQEGPPGASLLQ